MGNLPDGLLAHVLFTTLNLLPWKTPRLQEQPSFQALLFSISTHLVKHFPIRKHGNIF